MLNAFKINNKDNTMTKIYLLKVSKRNSRKKCQIFSKLTVRTLEKRQ